VLTLKKFNTKKSRFYSLVPQIVKGESNDSNITLQKSRTGRIEEWKKRTAGRITIY